MIEIEFVAWPDIIYTLKILSIWILAYIVFYWLMVFMYDITKLNRATAKVWPFGEWDVGYKNQHMELMRRNLPSRKEEAVDLYFRYKKSEIIEDCWIEKVGGFLDGIRIKPRKRKR